ncbi:RNA 2',3'-cyclic phosphodiesterase [Jeotgalibacillus soli]|uniref:RNA 2',3'-cyclic phosphodiesterase n=1 Tax=Jeotgalibacillus soli TaxID=889306 RepID=A0A0C2VHC5_9BACL|nr:RNA 2',3'-cyclic phosphodiesterase [Jeotgalibacillus soli]KIL43901.1 hypothetical protein KP78_37250 [Jeotgalibacillus soli]
MKTPHYFIALELPDMMKEAINGIIEDWQQFMTFKQWTHQDDLHITLAFLGEVKNTAFIRYDKLLKEMAAMYFQFNLSLDHSGYFGKKESPRILWIGPELNGSLNRIQKSVQQAVAKLGGKVDPRPFTPHVTLAKRWQGKDEFVLPEISASHYFKATHITLYKIHMDRLSKYEAVYRWPLTAIE